MSTGANCRFKRSCKKTAFQSHVGCRQQARRRPGYWIAGSRDADGRSQLIGFERAPGRSPTISVVRQLCKPSSLQPEYRFEPGGPISPGMLTIDGRPDQGTRGISSFANLQRRCESVWSRGEPAAGRTGPSSSVASRSGGQAGERRLPPSGSRELRSSSLRCSGLGLLVVSSWLGTFFDTFFDSFAASSKGLPDIVVT